MEPINQWKAILQQYEYVISSNKVVHGEGVP